MIPLLCILRDLVVVALSDSMILKGLTTFLGVWHLLCSCDNLAVAVLVGVVGDLKTRILVGPAIILGGSFFRLMTAEIECLVFPFLLALFLSLLR